MSIAIDMYLNQISMTGGIPFQVILPKAPASINDDIMSNDELYAKLLQGITDSDTGKTQNAKDAFRKFRVEVNDK